ncbi:hypothetical protein ES708_21990 [subsurface metagenome]
MLEAMILGALNVFTLQGMFYVALGSSVGYLFGFLPGLTASVALSLLIPLSYGMQPLYAIIMMAGTLGGVCFGGSISAILINTPGTGSSAATSIDGYVMSQQGRAGEALGASSMSSFLGHLIGIGLLIAVIPGMTRLVLLFGPPEWFALGVGGLCLIATVSGGSLLNGIIAGAIGLLLSTHGINPIVGSPRYTFGSMWLWDGIPLISFIVGTLALAEMIRLLTEGKSISKSGKIDTGGVMKGIKETFKHLPLVSISGAIGVIIGAIPGVGGSVSTWVALSQAKIMSKHPETFGKGNIEGVIAPEAANDATQGGALMPLLSLGIPGNPSLAVLLGAFIMHGIQPGQKLLTEDLDIVFTLIFAHLFGAFIACTIGLYLAKYLSKVTILPSYILVPIITMICLTGSFATRSRLSDVILTVIFAGVGYAMLKCNIPRVPMILGLILGPLVERSYQVSMQLSDGSLMIFLNRPYTIAFLLLIPLSLFLSIFLGKKRMSKTKSIG